MIKVPDGQPRTLGDCLGITDLMTPPEAISQFQNISHKFSARDFCRGILNSLEYRQFLRDRIVLGTLPPQIECMLWDRAEGKVVEKVEIKDTTDPLDNFDADQLEDRARRLLELARQLRTNDEVDKPLSEEDSVKPSPSSVH